MRTLIDLVAEAAVRFGDKPAVTTRSGLRDLVWSYAQLWQAVRTAARRLQEMGVQEGDRVLLVAPNSPHYVAGLLGAMLRGAIAVPLDLGSVAAFVAKVAEDTGAVVAIGHAEGSTLKLPSSSLAELVACSPRDYDGPLPEPDDIAEIIYTSGTTGSPKGVMLSHANIVASVLAATSAVRVTPDWRMLSLLPLSHMFEQTVGLFGPLMHGAEIHYGVPRQTAAIGKAMRRYRVNVIVAVPQLLTLMLQGIERNIRRDGRNAAWVRSNRLAGYLPITLRRLLFHRVHARLGRSFSLILCGGAYLAPEIEQAWERLGVRVVQGYGATECSPLITSNTEQVRLPGTVGRPALGAEVRIAADGEVEVCGPNVFSGYWHNETATAAALREGGWYRTGDLGEFDVVGNLRLKGRKKDRVVLPSGMNVFLEDVEQVLNRQPGVRGSVVVDVQRPNGEVGFDAALLMAGNGSAEEAVRLANAELAPHQRITGFSVWEQEDFPRTAIGKLRRHLVKAWLERRDNAGGASAAKEGGEVSPLQRVLAELSGVNAAAITAQSDLTLDLGLSSLARVELTLVLEETFNVTVEDIDLAQVERVGQLEQLIERGGSTQVGREVATWPLARGAALVRRLLQAVVLFPVHRLVARPFRVTGLENLRDVALPVLFIANHASHVDTVSIIRALPPLIRRRTAVAAAEDYFFHYPFVGATTSLLMNTFPFSREGAVRTSLEYCGYLADQGWSVLIYPEGTRSVTGELLPFKLGIGLLATQLGVPVLPVTVAGGRDVLPKGRILLSPAPVTVRFGRALCFAEKDDAARVTARLHQVVAEMMKEVPGHE